MPRARLVATLLAAVAALLLVQYVRLWAAIPADQARTSDFAGTYAAATLLRTGHASQMYDLPAEERVLMATGTPADHLNIPFEDPPAAAAVAVPLSLLDSTTAYRIFSLLQLFLVGIAAWIVVRAAPWAARTDRWIPLAIGGAAVAGVGTGLVFIEAQWDGVLVLGVALAYSGWRRGAQTLPGLLLGFTAAISKPHLALGLLAFMAGRRDWRGLAGAAAGGFLAMLLSVVTGGPMSLTAFVAALTEPSNSPVLYMQSAVGLTESWFGQSSASYAAGLALSGAALAIAAALGHAARSGSRLLEPAFFAAAALSLFAAPHLLGHDLTLLVPGFIAAAAWLTTRAEPMHWPGADTVLLIGSWVLLSLATQQDLGQSMAGPPGRITPMALLLVAAVAGAFVVRSGPAHEPDPPALRAGV